jgi:uncharacterized membrane protein YdbT with pleckstrin-like domain
MSYTSDSLTEGEVILFNSSFSKAYLWLDLISCSAVSIFLGAITNSPTVFTVMMVIFFIMAIPKLIRYFTEEYSITSRKILTKSGLISRNTDELPLKTIEGIDVKQSILDRILGAGTVVITGRGTQRVSFEGVDNPVSVKKQIEANMYVG